MNPISQHQDVFISFVENTKQDKSEKSPATTKRNNIRNRFSCDKCRFSSVDVDQFNKHVLQHVEMTFSCSYCNHVSYTRGESQRHLVKHTGTFPFKCQFCPYGAVRNDYIVKHTQRVHKVFEDRASYRVAKTRHHLEERPSSTETHTLASPASTDTDLRTAGVVGNPPVGSDAVRSQGNSRGLSKVQVELLSPLNGPLQHDKPLTIAYPPEMDIPPGCYVELVEVKTVNGTKELELKLVSQQQTAETKSPVKNVEAQTVRVDVQNSHVEKPTFRCSVIAQKSEIVKKTDFSSVKTVLNVSCNQSPNLKEEPKEPEREFVGKTRREAPQSVRQQTEPKSLSSGKLKSPSQPRSIVSTLGTAHNSTLRNIVKSTVPSKTCNIGELPCHIVRRQEVICDFPSHPKMNSFTHCDGGTVSKRNDCAKDSIPSVGPVSEKYAEDEDSHDGTSELPVISSVFSISQGSGDFPGCIRWEQALNNNLGVFTQNKNTCAVPEQGNSKTILSARHTSPSVDSCGGPKGGTNHMLTSKGEKGPNADGVKVDPPSPPCEPQRSPSLGQIHLLQLNEPLPCDLDINPTDAPAKQKNKKTPEDSMPTFIPPGAVLKISESNKPSITLKISSPSETTGSWMPRPVLFSSLNERNNLDMDHSCPSKVPKLSLKRRKSGTENKGLDDDWEQRDSQTHNERDDAWKLTKCKKRKKHKKASKVKSSSQVTEKTQRDTGRLWLIPLKEDQPVKCPGPDQPVVVLNHPKPQAFRVWTHMQTNLLKGEQSVTWHSRTMRQSSDQNWHTLKMKLKKVHQNKYQIVGFVFRDSPTDTQVLAR